MKPTKPFGIILKAVVIHTRCALYPLRTSIGYRLS